MPLIDLIFPKSCFSCKKGRKYICASCIGKVDFQQQLCIVCERPSIDGLTHIKCKRARGLDGALSIWKYEKVVKYAIIKLKYKFAYEIAKELSLYTAQFLKRNITALPGEGVLTPVPLHKTRQNWRGFNQASEVGKLLAEKMKWDFGENIVVRKTKTKPQTELRGKERERNLKGVFSFNDSYRQLITDLPTGRQGKRKLILFDDVWTTGTTLKEVCKVLKRNGAESVWALTLAK